MIENRSVVFNCFQLLAAKFVVRELSHGEVKSQKKYMFKNGF